MHTSSFFTIKCSDLFILKKIYGAISSELVQESSLKSYEKLQEVLIKKKKEYLLENLSQFNGVSLKVVFQLIHIVNDIFLPLKNFLCKFKII
jgi:hypothetical protein